MRPALARLALANATLFERNLFRLEDPEQYAPLKAHEKDRLPVIWPLDSFTPVADAIGF
jgi:hypothetical protein